MSGLLENEQVKGLAREDSVRGELVRTVLDEAVGADAETLRLLEKSLQLLLGRFQKLESEGR